MPSNSNQRTYFIRMHMMHHLWKQQITQTCSATTAGLSRNHLKKRRKYAAVRTLWNIIWHTGRWNGALCCWFPSTYFHRCCLTWKGTMLVFLLKYEQSLCLGLSEGGPKVQWALNYQVKDFTEPLGQFCSCATASHGTPVTFVLLIVVRFFKGPA